MTVIVVSAQHMSSHDTLHCVKVWKLSEIFKALRSKGKLSLCLETPESTLHSYILGNQSLRARQREREIIMLRKRVRHIIYFK